MGFCKIHNNRCIDFLVGKYYILLRSYCLRLVHHVEMSFYSIIVKGKIGERERRERGMNVISSHSICSFGHLGILSILRPLNSPSSVPRNNRYYDLAPAVNFSFKSALNAKTYFPIKLKLRSWPVLSWLIVYFVCSL